MSETDDEQILRLQARVERVTLHPRRAELVLTVPLAGRLADDALILAWAAGRDCAIALQLAPVPAA